MVAAAEPPPATNTDVVIAGVIEDAEMPAVYRLADTLVFPSLIEGFGLAIIEAMACGLPAIASDATAGPDVLTARSGRIVRRGELEALVEALRWFAGARSRLPEMSAAARSEAERWTWGRYRKSVSQAVAPFL